MANLFRKKSENEVDGDFGKESEVIQPIPEIIFIKKKEIIKEQSKEKGDV